MFRSFLTPKNLFKVETFRLQMTYFGQFCCIFEENVLIFYEFLKFEILKIHKISKRFPQKYNKIGQNMSEKCFLRYYLFCPGDLVTRTGDCERFDQSVPAELA